MRPLLALLLIACGSNREAPPEHTPVPDQPRDEAPPVANADGVLVIPATKRDDGAYELRFGKGRALLSLDDGTFVGTDPERGAIALDVLAKWLGVPVPPKTHTTKLEPLRFDMIAMGGDQNKVFFKRGADYAEMYINVQSAGDIELVQKDPEYAPALADMFADALRDGFAPPRTLANDPNLASAEPVFRSKRAVEIADALLPHCFAEGWLVFVPTATGEIVQLAKWGESPKLLCELPGAADEVARGAHSPHVAIALTKRDPTSGVIDSGSTAELWLASPKGCRAIAAPKDIKLAPFMFIHLSPSGADIAFAAATELVTIPVDKGKSTRTPLEALDTIYAWDDDGIQLVDLGGKRARIQPAGKRVPLDHATAISPDGAYTVTLGAASIDVLDRAKRSTRTFKPTIRSDLRAIARLANDPPEWLGAHGLILAGSPDLVLDLATLRLQPLSPADAEVACTSPDGTHALFTDGKTFSEAVRK